MTILRVQRCPQAEYLSTSGEVYVRSWRMMRIVEKRSERLCVYAPYSLVVIVTDPEFEG